MLPRRMHFVVFADRPHGGLIARINRRDEYCRRLPLYVVVYQLATQR